MFQMMYVVAHAVYSLLNASADVYQSETLSSSGIKRLLLRLERAANKNQVQRSKYPDDPTK